MSDRRSDEYAEVLRGGARMYFRALVTDKAREVAQSYYMRAPASLPEAIQKFRDAVKAIDADGLKRMDRLTK